ncbi:hypothetical protein R8Z50_29790 [Longispora sp. K20-0274]|uniref:hypothetical protein n=1 Tax=Longispora sp. K20-0274 TaxID=3088255 RepID=UPI00399A306C
MRAIQRLTVAAIALTVAFAATPAEAALPGHQLVSTVSVSDSATTKSATATCPAGKQVVGAGAYIDGVEGQVILDDLIPTATTVRATGYEIQGGTTANWWIRAFAVCASPLPGYEIVTTAGASSSANKTATAACPAGKQVIGSGAAVTGGLGQVVMGTMQPSSTGTTVIGYEDADGTAATWYLTAYAICATAPAGTEIVTSTTLSDSLNKSASPTCPAGKLPLGQGWAITTTEPGRVVSDIAMPTANGAMAVARESGAVGTSWSLSARVVCATQ